MSPLKIKTSKSSANLKHPKLKETFELLEAMDQFGKYSIKCENLHPAMIQAYILSHDNLSSLRLDVFEFAYKFQLLFGINSLEDTLKATNIMNF